MGRRVAGGYGGGGGSLVIPDAYYFDDDTARDAYFGTHASELVEGVQVVVGITTKQLQKYLSTVWTDVTPIVRGPAGADGEGVPDGGTTGQVLKKKSNTDQDTEWGDGSGGGTWGSITGTLSDQTDLDNALGGKATVVTSATEPETPDENMIWIDTADTSVPMAALDTDGTMAANSDSKVPSQKAVKTYADQYSPAINNFYTPWKLYSGADVEKSIKRYGTCYQNANADGDYFLFKIWCIGNETVLDLSWQKGPACGIFDIYLNDVLDSSSYDGYSGTSPNTLTSITLTRNVIPGMNVFKFKVNGKNASSTAYQFTAYGVSLR